MTAAVARQAHALRTAAALIEQAGIGGLSIAVNAPSSASIHIMVPVECGCLARRRAAVERLAAAAGTCAVRRDYHDSPLLGAICAEGSRNGHQVSIFTVIPDLSS